MTVNHRDGIERALELTLFASSAGIGIIDHGKFFPVFQL
jgi:hypothetical protein